MLRSLLILLSVIISLPGLTQAYFQQRVEYTIEVKLDDKEHFLRAREQVVYVNNSPDTLSYLIFHLWPNAYSSRSSALCNQLLRNGNTKLFFAEEEDIGYIDSLDFKVDDEMVEWEFDASHVDICTLQLNEPLIPGESLEVSTPFRVKIPSGKISRLGHLGQSYQITQWYPKPAVYDHNGWNGMPYLNQGEFYSEFGSFDVTIKLPSNYKVGATGDIQNEDEIASLTELADSTLNWIHRMEDSARWSDYAENMKFPESSEEWKTLRYTQDNVHDYAWFADKRYKVLKGEVETPYSGDKVDVWTFFTARNAKEWARSIEYMHDAVYYYSLWNGDYPYKHATAVDGTISAGGGMEYPNVTVIGNTNDALGLETVIMHEVGHNWFYGILGSNERRYTWLDEGLNSYNEQRYLSTKYPERKLLSKEEPGFFSSLFGFDKYNIKDQYYFMYLLSARHNHDQKLDLPADEYYNINYGTMCYAKSAVFFNYLRHYLGDEAMDAAMQSYFDRHKFSHPEPKDLEKVFTESTSKDLDWIFQDAINTTAKLDYKISRVKKLEDGYRIKLKNKGRMNSPVHVAQMDGDSVLRALWINGFQTDTTISVTGHSKSIKIDPRLIMPEINRKNNRMRTTGVFRKIEAPQVRLLGGIEDPTKNQLFVTPILGANIPNGFIPGVLLMNSIIPVKRLNYALVPMFGTKGSNLVGVGDIYYMIAPYESAFESIDVGVRGKRFQKKASDPSLLYNRIEPYVRFNFRPRDYSGYWNHELTMSSIWVMDQYTDVLDSKLVKDTTSFYNRVEYTLDFKHPIYRSDFTVLAEQNNDFAKISFEANNITNLANLLKIRSRFFVGYYLSNVTNNAAFNWRMNGQGINTDYSYDYNLFDRSGVDGFFSRQMIGNHGAFKVPTAVAQSATGLVALNLKVSYKSYPFGIFLDIGESFEREAAYNVGFFVGLIQRHLFVYIPFAYSSNIQNEINTNGLKFTDLIRFEYDIRKINPIKLRRKLSF